MHDIESDRDMMTIPSTLDQIAAIDEFVEEWLRHRNVPEDTIADMAIAITELVNNAIKHGNKMDKDKKVIVSLSYSNDEIRASIRDEGFGFDLDQIPNPIAEENLLKEIGRGIFIVRSLMDNVNFKFSKSDGTEVTIIKRMP